MTVYDFQDPSALEAHARRTLEPMGLTLVRFWITSDGLGHCEAADARGRLFLFNQKAPPPPHTRSIDI